jgi:hypothetical protein
VIRARDMVVVLALGMANLAHAQGPEVAKPQSVTVIGVAVGDGYRLGLGGRTTQALAQTIREKGDRVRVDFEAGGKRGSVLRDKQGAWLISEAYNAALPLVASTTARPIIFDTQAPCRAIDARCERAEDVIILGRPAVGWTFRHAGSRGPDGTDSGIMWLDRETGVLLAHRSEDMSRRKYEWRTTSIDFTPLDDTLFDLPSGLQKVSPKNLRTPSGHGADQVGAAARGSQAQ